MRETVITTFDGRRVLIPNAKVCTDVIHVQTAHETIRGNFVGHRLRVGHGGSSEDGHPTAPNSRPTSPCAR